MEQKFYAVIDTETIGEVQSNFCHAYHLGAVAIDRKGNILDNINIIILSNLLMDTAYYGKMKKEYYRNLVKDGDVIICYDENEALEVFQTWLDYNYITTICAYNSSFDFEKTLIKDIKNSYEFIDILKAFQETIAQTKGYDKFCKDNGYLTKYGKNRMTAEIAYRYISGDNSFIEEHTALSDAEIETLILLAVWDTHKRFTRNCHAIQLSPPG